MFSLTETGTRLIEMRMEETIRYTKAEVALQNGSNNNGTWIVYKDSVYDVSRYIDEHPGGRDAILGEAGKDATKAFNEVGHSSDATTIMAKYKIGEIVEEEKVYDANGKKKKRVVEAQSNDSRSCMSVVTCGLLG
ncbi:hypothetical protein K1T71_011599 [Dendrolimus kikuchii]|uniref:Uncharacterized protein n=1 Tax=Dendrolimus kikuchii TaxID=765133 RepID=A0ACC1CLI4_9NEOP|nr:hypothetical protein K1T71_011599 [Dendrolimus kikuchii]